MYNRGAKRPVLVSHGGSATFDTNELDQQPSMSPASEEDTPRSKSRVAAKLLLPQRYTSGALLAAAALLAFACFVILSKHRQYDRAQHQAEAVYQVGCSRMCQRVCACARAHAHAHAAT